MINRLDTDLGVNRRHWSFGVAVVYRDPRRPGGVFALGVAIGPVWAWLDFIHKIPRDMDWRAKGKEITEVPR